MDRNKIIIMALVVIIIALAAGIVMVMTNTAKGDMKGEANNATTIANETASAPAAPNTITVKLPEFDTKYTKTAGEYTVEAQKWRGGSVGGFEVHLYKNGDPVYKDSYMTRAYFYMDGEWKWSDWGNGEDGYEGYHRYPVSSGVEIKEVEVTF